MIGHVLRKQFRSIGLLKPERAKGREEVSCRFWRHFFGGLSRSLTIPPPSLAGASASGSGCSVERATAVKAQPGSVRSPRGNCTDEDREISGEEMTDGEGGSGSPQQRDAGPSVPPPSPSSAPASKSKSKPMPLTSLVNDRDVAVEKLSAEEMNIYRLHRDACRAGQKSYLDPSTGYVVLTQRFHIAKAKCCGNACRHCPYGHANVPEKYRTKTFNTAFFS